MITLRDKVQELADNWMIPRLAALAIARLVVEHCVGVCENLSDKFDQEYGTAMYDCAAAIRKELEELK